MGKSCQNVRWWCGEVTLSLLGVDERESTCSRHMQVQHISRGKFTSVKQARLWVTGPASKCLSAIVQANKLARCARACKSPDHRG